MTRFFLSAVLLCLSFNAHTQSYGSTIGLRFGNNNVSRTLGISYKYRILKKTTLEGILQTDFSHNTTFHAMIMRHRGIISKRFNFYAGTGFSIGNEQSEVLVPENNTTLITYGNTTFGADVIVGIEFTLMKHSFSLDYKPNFNFVGREPWYRGQVGITARTVLLTGSQQNKRRKRRQKEKRKLEKEQSKSYQNAAAENNNRFSLKGIFKKAEH